MSDENVVIFILGNEEIQTRLIILPKATKKRLAAIDVAGCFWLKR